MKSIRNIAFSALLTFGAFGAITYTSCNKDECKDVVCQNGGTCNEGTCSCTTGYTGTNCENAYASELPGTYSGTETCQPPVVSDDWSSTLTVSSNDKTRIIIANFGNSGANVTGQVDKNAIILDETTIGGNTVKGTGTVAGNVITVNYTMSGVVSYSCTMVLTRQ